MYQLIIYHDVGVVNKEGNLEIDKDSPGHVYLELKGDDDSIVCGVLSGLDLDLSDPKKTYNSYQKYIIHGQERLKLAKEYEHQNPNKNILHSKTIKLNEEQYLKGVILLDEYKQYIGKEIPSKIYGLLGNNCTHFVKHIYRSMGLEGDYTRNYRESELNQINTKLTNSYKALFNLHAGDEPFTVFGSSVEEVAKKYNVDVSKVKKKELSQGVTDMEAAMLQEACDQISFVVEPKALLQEQISLLESENPSSKTFNELPSVDLKDLDNQIIANYTNIDKKQALQDANYITEKNYYHTSQGLTFSLYNCHNEEKFANDLYNMDLSDLNNRNDQDKTLLRVAIEKDKNLICSTLINLKVSLDNDNQDLLFIATKRQNYEAAKLLLETKDYRDTISATLDYATVFSHNIELLKLLVKCGGRLSEYYYQHLFDNIITEEGAKVLSSYDKNEFKEFYTQYVTIEENNMDVSIIGEINL
jgi:hypothetical protein